MHLEINTWFDDGGLMLSHNYTPEAENSWRVLVSTLAQSILLILEAGKDASEATDEEVDRAALAIASDINYVMGINVARRQADRAAAEALTHAS